MASYLGVDWASGCWLVVKAGDDPLVTTEPSILNVWHEHGDDVRSILVDIPIGLPEEGPRECDEEARQFLKGRGSTVFSVPGREVVETDDYGEARENNDGSLGSQSWWLFPRIKEVDVFLQEYDDARKKTYESHPEVCFAKLAGEGLPAKDTEEGVEERVELLNDDPELPEEISGIPERYDEKSEWHERISKGRLDDVVDAAVLAYTAKQLELGPRDGDHLYHAFRCDANQRDEELGITPEIVHPGPIG